MLDKINAEWNKLLEMENVSPYLFRTRIERAIKHSIRYADLTRNIDLLQDCDTIKYKLKYISDQSNQTADGMLNSYSVLRKDMYNIIKLLS